ncbi:tRNA (5-methylaminomethyl-2-thiouridine)(34)-methyltransferase MnmD [Sulfurimonas sp.]|uniref:tRNA (5-methylaminomethyl-2-thiouridine)(34)-methyltransferase MnmD n=1 Tax=Sulfurimonas sp. TaxID=2022749 RepID=UPI002AB0A31C|nr:MnmC family methyltransferase [Sulfurimonas sp.]
MSFNDKLHRIILSDDGTYTAYSKEYDEHYHSTKDGALNESLLKHVEPAFSILKNKDEINILDICYGLGFNTLATLYYHKKNSLISKINIYSPELDATLLSSLNNFTYPKEFENLKEIIYKLCEDGIYDDEFFHIEVFVGDAREYVRKFTNKFDIVYQDAFSPSSNPTLWTLEYFEDLKKAMREEGILTTYSISLATRLALWQNGFNIYINSSKNIRASTVASIQKLQNFKEVDMPHKISCNPDAKPLRD